MRVIIVLSARFEVLLWDYDVPRLPCYFKITHSLALLIKDAWNATPIELIEIYTCGTNFMLPLLEIVP